MGVAAANGIELLERTALARGRLLRIERFRNTASRQTGLALTFDVGRVTLEPEAGGGLVIADAGSREDLPPGLEALDEEEPWWRVLGNPLTQVRPGVEGELQLRFREAPDSPRTISIIGRGAGLAARLEAAETP